jgi:hypothetical protein
MWFRRAMVCVVAAGVFTGLGSLSGCATSAAQMTPQQKEGVELRRFCEQNPNEVAKCLGFLGFA